MKAMIQQRFGPPREVLSMAEIEKPTIGDDDVLVRNRASSANPYDWHFIKGEPLFFRVAGLGVRKPKHAVQGGDLAGTVEAVGRNVTAFKPRDDVYGFVHGSFAEYVSCPPDRIALKPSNLTFEEAATVPLAAITALQGLRDSGQVGPGQHVMIVGASGGVGHIAVQIAKSYGAEVTGVCSTANLDMVRELGADHVIDYTTGDITSGERRFDVVFQLGGTDSASSLRRVMKREGILVLCAGDGGRWFGPIGNMLKAMLTNPFVSQRTTVLLAKERTEDLDVIRGLVESGTIRPVVSQTYQFEQTGEAVQLVEVGRPQGKVAISIS